MFPSEPPRQRPLKRCLIMLISSFHYPLQDPDFQLLMAVYDENILKNPFYLALEKQRPDLCSRVAELHGIVSPTRRLLLVVKPACLCQKHRGRSQRGLTATTENHGVHEQVQKNVSTVNGSSICSKSFSQKWTENQIYNGLKVKLSREHNPIPDCPAAPSRRVIMFEQSRAHPEKTFLLSEPTLVPK